MAEDTLPGDDVAYSIQRVTEITPYSRSAVYNLINDKRLKAKKDGRKVLIMREDLVAFLASLPEAA